MSWDPTLVDPTDVPADGLLLRAVGGRTGPIALENGAKLTLPWKSQQQLSGTTPAYIQAVETDSGAVHRQDFYFAGPSLLVGTTGPYLRLSMNYTDDATPSARTVFLTADGTNGFAAYDFGTYRNRVEGNLLISSGTMNVASPSKINLDTGGGIEALTSGWIDVAGDAGHRTFIGSGSAQNLTIQGGSTSDVLVNAQGSGGDLTLSSSGGAVTVSANTTMAISAGTTMSISAADDITISTTGTGDDIIIDPVGVLTCTGSAISLVSDGNGNVTITASGTGDLALTGAPVTINGVDVSTLLGQWTDHTPTITQSGSVTKTTTYSRAVKIGRTVIWSFLLNVTGSGTGGSTVTLSTPYTAAQAGNMTVGAATLYNGATNIQGEWALNATTTIAMYQSGGFYTTALASGNAITGTVVYEAAS